MRSLRYGLEGALFGLALLLFRTLPVDWASALGAQLGRRIGPHLNRLSDIARRNLERAFPKLSAPAIEAIVLDMWDNLGRTLAEYPHLDTFYTNGRVEIVGAENVIRLRDDGIGGIFFSAHYGNWELLSLSLDHFGLPPILVYRPANNPFSERLIQLIRNRAHKTEGVEYIEKSNLGLRAMVKALRAHKHLAMLVDQKMNNGIPVDFFGYEAMTAPAIAQLALKYRIPIVPAKMQRLGGTRFRITFFPPMALDDYVDDDAGVAALMRRINVLFEKWISERPDHWLWIHNRWPKHDRNH